MTTPQNEGSMMIYLLIDGAEPMEIPGVERFDLIGESPEAYRNRENARWDSPLRARYIRRVPRWRRTDPEDLKLTLGYDPRNWVHQVLLAAGEEDVRLTLRRAICDATGRAMHTQDVNCSVLRYTLSLVAANRSRSLKDGRSHALAVNLRLKRHGDFRDVTVSPRDEQGELAANRLATFGSGINPNFCGPKGQSQCLAEPHLAACVWVSDCGSGGGSNGTEVKNKNLGQLRMTGTDTMRK